MPLFGTDGVRGLANGPLTNRRATAQFAFGNAEKLRQNPPIRLG